MFGLIQTLVQKDLAQQRLERTCQGDLAHVFYKGNLQNPIWY